MSSKATISLTTGVSGSGKTYYRCAVFLLDEWLPNHDGKLISNYPINVEEVEKDFHGASERIELIPKEVLKSWRDGSSGPWDYFKDRDISGAHIAIDEIHNFCGKTTDAKVRKKWQQFIGELRHQGATMEFLTQAEIKCAKEILAEAEIRREIINGENRRFPIFGYRMGDLYQFRAKLLRKYLCPSFCIEYLQASGKWVKQEEHIFYRLPSYFKYYDSFSAPEHGNASGNKAEKQPWEKYSWLGLVLWFYLQYPLRITFQVLILVSFYYIFWGGGFENIMDKWLMSISPSYRSKHMEQIEKKETQEQGIEQNQTQGQKVNNQPVKDVTGKIIGRLVVKNPYPRPYIIFACENYIRDRDGFEYKLGDDFLGSRIVLINPRGKYFVLEDGFIMEW